MITRYIADLLYHQDCVIVPGLGGFLKAYHPAQIHHAILEFHPPSGNVAFNAGLSGNDGQLANHIASVENISYREALYEIKLWVEKCFDSINKGDKVDIEGIGNIFMNASGNLEFSPSYEVNFNSDSFGLSVFHLKAADQGNLILPDIQPTNHAYRSAKFNRLVPETLKWAAVLAPFVAFILWGSLNGNVIENYVHNYTGMYSWVRSTPGKTAPVKTVILPLNAKAIPVVENVKSPAGILADQNISFDPGMVSYTELAQNKITISDPVAIVSTEVSSREQDYFIIGGAFRDHNNALKLISILEQQGYAANIVDTTAGGLYIVSMKAFASYNEAVSQLGEIKKAGFASSWILKKQRG